MVNENSGRQEEGCNKLNNEGEPCSEKDHLVFVRVHVNFPELKEDIGKQYGKIASEVYQSNYTRLYAENIERGLSQEVAHTDAHNGAKLLTFVEFAPNLNGAFVSNPQNS